MSDENLNLHIPKNDVQDETSEDTINQTEMPEITAPESENQNIEIETKIDNDNMTFDEVRCPNCQALLNEEADFCPECGTQLKKICQNCGNEVLAGQAFCSSCGQKIDVSCQSPAADTYGYNPQIATPKKKSKTLFIVLGIVLAICLCTACFFAVNINGKTVLHHRLMDDEWSGLSSDGDTLLYLDFSDDEINYSGYFGILGKQHVADIDYEVVDGDTIKVYGREIHVKFSKSGDAVTFTPSFIDSRSSNTWTK